MSVVAAYISHPLRGLHSSPFLAIWWILMISQHQPPSIRLSSSFSPPRGSTSTAMSTSLWLACQASCCSIHTVAMVLTGAVLQFFQGSSVLSVSWVENAAIPLIFHAEGVGLVGWHPFCCHSCLQTGTHQHSTRLKLRNAAWRQRGLLFRVGHVSSIWKLNDVRRAEQIWLTPAKRPRCRKSGRSEKNK